MATTAPKEPTSNRGKNLKQDIKDIGKDIKEFATDTVDAAKTIQEGSTASVKKAVKDFKAK